ELMFSYRMFRDLEKRPEGLASIAGFRRIAVNLAFGNQTINARALAVSRAYFSTLGVRPFFGRLLSPEDDENAGNPVAVLSYGYWRDRLGGRYEVLNQPLRVSGLVFTIVGVAPRRFTGTTLASDPDIFVPISF